MAGALVTLPLLDPHRVPPWLGWRLCFVLGSLLGLGILLIRSRIPESPRWLMTHGRHQEAERIVAHIEETVKRTHALAELPAVDGSIEIRELRQPNFLTVARELVVTYPQRTVLGATLMVSQSFLYNAIFFSYALVLSRFYGVAAGRVGLYILPFAAFNFCGPLLLGRLFDSIGRRPMISFTYGTSGVLLCLTGWLFAQGQLTATSQTLLWSAVFFFASAGASSAYLTVSEVFPLEIRAMAIACFFVVSQGAGVAAPWIFGKLIQSSAISVFYGYLLGAGMMIAAALVTLRFGVRAERRSPEEIATPLSARRRS